ncbi:MAG TPA: gliding motility-associated C-terminal domain-containing protein, partial [Saprospiraceae bacterium]
TIPVNVSGEYSVTVSNGILCPNADTVEVEMLPVIQVALIGDVVICDNQSATLTLQTNSPFPITVVIEADPGSPFVLDNVMGNYSFTDLPQDNTTYTITSVTPSMEACITVTDGEQIIDVFPSYIHSFDVSICDGDSVWLGFYWETEAGVYENLLETEYGCDSMVTTSITILPAVQIAQQSTTCDPSAAGVFITHLDNPNGCDTVLTTTVTLLPSDTAHVLLNTCLWTQSGIETDTFSNQNGCDSLVITTTNYIPPSDTTFIQELTCDSSLLGFTYDTLTTTSGCDSIVALTVSFSLIDTTYTFGTSCILSEIGVFQTLLTDASGCDSLVIRTITQGEADTTAIFTTSCNPASIGVFEELLTSSQGCDSLIVTIVTFSAQDSTFISSSTCDPSAAGIFVTPLINQFGCDSIVTETVSLLPSDATSLSSNTCDPSAAGVFMQMLINQYGCDSIVTENVTLLPSDQTSLASTTCIASQAGVFVTTLTNQYGCDSVITETITLLPGDTTSFVFNTCNPAQVGNVETIYAGQDGCDSLVIETTTLYSLPVVIVQSAIEYNGFDISCAGDADGSAIANASGIAPFDYLWSTSDIDPLITGLSAGNYAVSVTDGNGCTTDGVITLTEPVLFMIGFEISEPDCFDQELGSITVKAIGGVAPYTYSIDGTVFQSSPDFTGLSEGIYQITSLDANDCSATEIISIDVPLMVQVELGDNQVISLGDSSLLQAIVNLPFDSLSSVMWTGIDSIDCPNCLTQIVAPIITTAYTVSVTSIDGCADRDTMTVSVTTDQKVYVPNIFSPNGDGVNDVLSISVGEDVQEISSFSIFDRWGNLVFGAEHNLPNDPTISWDGKMKGETMNPGVFTYKAIILYISGEREVIYGDVTLIR